MWYIEEKVGAEAGGSSGVAHSGKALGDIVAGYAPLIVAPNQVAGDCALSLPSRLWQSQLHLAMALLHSFHTDDHSFVLVRPMLTGSVDVAGDSLSTLMPAASSWTGEKGKKRDCSRRLRFNGEEGVSE